MHPFPIWRGTVSAKNTSSPFLGFSPNIVIISHFLLPRSQIEDINLVRDDDTGKSRGFAFVKYEDSRSCILAVDNFAGTKVLGRSMRVDHCEKYRLPKELLEKEEARRTDPGHAYQGKDMANDFSIEAGQDLFAKPIESRPEPLDDSKESKRKRKEERNQIRMDREEKRQSNPKDDSKDAKRKRKEERSQTRKERKEKRHLKEEKRRQKRIKRDFDSDRDDGKRKRRKKDP